MTNLQWAGIAFIALAIIPNLVYNKELKLHLGARIIFSILPLLSAVDMFFVKHEDPPEPAGIIAPVIIALIGFIILMAVGNTERFKVK